MKTSTTFSFIPRFKILESDLILLNLRNEKNNEILTPDFTFSITDRVNIVITEDVLNEGDKYEIEIKRGTDIVYLGKLLVLNPATDRQNYTYGTSKFTFRSNV